MRRAVVLSLALLAFAAAGERPSPWPKALPALRLEDPLGRAFDDAHLCARGAVVVASAPTLAQGDAQRAWSRALDSLVVDADAPALVLLEDMSQSWFRGVALSQMKASYRAEGRLLLLLDERGTVRRALGVGENATVALAFAPGGALAAVETRPATPERAARLLEAAWATAPAPRTP